MTGATAVTGAPGAGRCTPFLLLLAGAAAGFTAALLTDRAALQRAEQLARRYRIPSPSPAPPTAAPHRAA